MTSPPARFVEAQGFSGERHLRAAMLRFAGMSASRYRRTRKESRSKGCRVAVACTVTPWPAGQGEALVHSLAGIMHTKVRCLWPALGGKCDYECGIQRHERATRGTPGRRPWFAIRSVRAERRVVLHRSAGCMWGAGRSARGRAAGAFAGGRRLRRAGAREQPALDARLPRARGHEHHAQPRRKRI